MKLESLAIADIERIDELIEEGEWVMLISYQSPGELVAAQALISDPLRGEAACYENYTWFQLDAKSAEAESILDELEIDQVSAFVILSLYRGERKSWILDDFENRDAEDLNQFMDDHAGILELEDDDF